MSVAKYVTGITITTSTGTPPELAADNSAVGDDLSLVFDDNATWRTGITDITVSGNSIPTSQYSKAAGKITLKAGAYFPVAGSYPVVVKSDGYNDATVTQSVYLAFTGSGIPPVLTADITNQTVGQAVYLHFTDDIPWRTDITGVTVNGSPISTSQYSIIAGEITINADVFPVGGSYLIVVKANGYTDTAVVQNLIALGTIIQTWKGWIMDTDCVGVNPLTHTTGCLKMSSCIASGLGVLVYNSGATYQNYIFIPFDNESQSLGVNLINSIPATQTNNVTIQVTGTLNGSVIDVSTIEFYSIPGISTWPVN